jgi:hypothetical protein
MVDHAEFANPRCENQRTGLAMQSPRHRNGFGTIGKPRAIQHALTIQGFKPFDRRSESPVKSVSEKQPLRSRLSLDFSFIGVEKDE